MKFLKINLFILPDGMKISFAMPPQIHCTPEDPNDCNVLIAINTHIFSAIAHNILDSVNINITNMYTFLLPYTST